MQFNIFLGHLRFYTVLPFAQFYPITQGKTVLRFTHQPWEQLQNMTEFDSIQTHTHKIQLLAFKWQENSSF